MSYLIGKFFRHCTGQVGYYYVLHISSGKELFEEIVTYIAVYGTTNKWGHFYSCSLDAWHEHVPLNGNYYTKFVEFIPSEDQKKFISSFQIKIFAPNIIGKFFHHCSGNGGYQYVLHTSTNIKTFEEMVTYITVHEKKNQWGYFMSCPLRDWNSYILLKGIYYQKFIEFIPLEDQKKFINVFIHNNFPKIKN
jgi:hypothetical protein